MNTITNIEQKSLNIHDSAIEQQTVNIHDSVINLSENNSELLDDTELELERIMFEEFAYGLPSDIPMCDL